MALEEIRNQMWTLLQWPGRATDYGRRRAIDSGSVLDVNIMETGPETGSRELGTKVRQVARDSNPGNGRETRVL